MKTKEIFKTLVNEIHSVVVATLDDKGLPSTRVIDMMLYDKEGIYFLTAKGKAFYQELMTISYISLSGMSGGGDTMSKKAITIKGYVQNIGAKKRDEIFEKNAYMKDIYPSLESREALEVFCICSGVGDFFDLSVKPIKRQNFAFGGEKVKEKGFFIGSTCKECGECLKTCPTGCIELGIPYMINQANCLHCGNCYEVCPDEAIRKVG